MDACVYKVGIFALEHFYIIVGNNVYFMQKCIPHYYTHFYDLTILVCGVFCFEVYIMAQLIFFHSRLNSYVVIICIGWCCYELQAWNIMYQRATINRRRRNC
jgi:hypothetical protein